MLWVTIGVSALASQAQNYGLGGETTGRANSVIAEVSNPYAALYNPSLIAAQTSYHFGFSTGVQQSKFSSDANLNLRDQSLLTWSLGYSLPFQISEASHRQGGIGVALSGPYQKLRSFSAYSPEDVFLMRYGSSDSQFKASLGAAIELLPQSLYFGGGVSLYLSTAGTAEENIVGQNPTGRMALDVGLNSAAILGLYTSNAKTQTALTFHQALDPGFTQAIDGKISIAGSDVLHQPMVAKSTLYYEPQTLEFEGQHQFGNLKASLGIAYEFWSRYKAPILLTEAKDNLGQTRVTQITEAPLKNTWNPRVSVEYPISNSWSLSSGYQFRPSPIVDLSGPSNYLDSNAHILGLSLTHSLSSSELIPWPMRLGVYGQYHWINSRTVTKTGRSVLDKSSTPDRYTFQGNAAVYGLCLQSAL